MTYQPTKQELERDRGLNDRFAEGARQQAALDAIGEKRRAAWARLHQEIRERGGLILSPLTLQAIQAEATRAHIQHGDHSMAGEGYSSGDRLAILVEEYGEAAEARLQLELAAAIGRVGHALTYDQDPDGRQEKLEKELIQVAAMAATWIELAAKGLG